MPLGAATKQGVKKFQTSKRLTADGIAGRDTFAKLAGVLTIFEHAPDERT